MPKRHQRRSGAVFTAVLDPSFEKLSYSPKYPPTGYMFVPKGDVYVTRHCRDLTRKAGETLYLVFNSNTRKRIGLHCPIQIHETVEEDAAASVEKRQRAVANKDQRVISHARELLSQQFPCIPRDSAEEILEHGFLKGSGRVGRSTTLDDELKIELAVNAHIRHRFTDYDSLYNEMKAANVSGDMKKIARTRVYDQVTKTAQSWRGIGAARPSVSLEVMDEMIEESQKKMAARQGPNPDNEIQPRSRYPPQRHAAMVANLSLKEQSGFEQKEAEPFIRGSTSSNFLIRHPEKSSQASYMNTHEGGPDHRDTDDEQLHKSNTKDEIIRRKALPKAIKAKMYEERAKEDLELLKLDASHAKRMNRSRAKRVVKLQKKITRETPLGSSVSGLKGQETEVQLLAKDPRRAAKLAKRKRTREKRAVEDLRHYELDSNIRLPKKRMNRVQHVQRQMRIELGDEQYGEMAEKRRQGANTAGHCQTDLRSLSVRPSTGQSGALLAQSTTEDLEKKLDRMDIS